MPKDAKAIDEGTDTYDTIDWLLKNVPNNNGRVGMLGISYPGWLTVMALLDPHPALKAASPQASPADMFLGDDFHHNGAFRLSYGFEYVAMMETDKSNANFAFDRYDTFEWYLEAGRAGERQSEVLQGQDADLERFRRASQLRRFLEETGVGSRSCYRMSHQDNMRFMSGQKARMRSNFVRLPIGCVSALTQIILEPSQYRSRDHRRLTKTSLAKTTGHRAILLIKVRHGGTRTAIHTTPGHDL